jgi:hypothetical protein
VDAAPAPGGDSGRPGRAGPRRARSCTAPTTPATASAARGAGVRARADARGDHHAAGEGEITSYRDLPKNFYQIATKFRNEIRPRYGLMRAREFVMKDAYSFDVDDEARSQLPRDEAAYTAFFARCGLKTISVEADTGVMGGSFSHEFMVPAEVGDDDVVYCEESGYAANREKATSGLVPRISRTRRRRRARGISDARAS